MSDLLPIFPLPNVVLFPNVFLPLHIFEPRYREMIVDALAGDRLIGMVLLKPGWESSSREQPPVYPIGCSGVITHVERLPDGRYNIVLRGVERFRVLREDQDRCYRRAAIEPVTEEEPTPRDQTAIRSERARLEALLAPTVEGRGEPRIPAAMPDADLVNTLAQYLDLEPLEKQALLEQNGIRARAASLVELLEMKIFISRCPSMTALEH